MKDKFRLKKDWHKYKKGKIFDSYGGLVSGIAANDSGDGLHFNNSEYFELIDISSSVKTLKQFNDLIFNDVQSEIIRIQNKISITSIDEEALNEAEEIINAPYSYALNPALFQLGKEMEAEARELRIREILDRANSISKKIQETLSSDEKRFLRFVQESRKNHL